MPLGSCSHMSGWRAQPSARAIPGALRCSPRRAAAPGMRLRSAPRHSHQPTGTPTKCRSRCTMTACPTTSPRLTASACSNGCSPLSLDRPASLGLQGPRGVGVGAFEQRRRRPVAATVAVPPDAEAVAIGGVCAEMGLQTLVDDRVLRSEQQLIGWDRITEIGHLPAHRYPLPATDPRSGTSPKQGGPARASPDKGGSPGVHDRADRHKRR